MEIEDQPLNICVTGNISSGKTIFAKLLAEAISNSCYVPEPFENNPFLPLHLQDQKRWAFTSTLYYFWDYAQVFQERTSAGRFRYHFIDAGIWTNTLVYGRYLRNEEIINPDEYAFYETLCKIIQKAYRHPDADGFILINASPQTCWQRMHERGWRFQTSAIDLGYIETLRAYFEDMKQILKAKSAPILELSSEAIDYTRPAGQKEALRRARRFLDAMRKSRNP